MSDGMQQAMYMAELEEANARLQAEIAALRPASTSEDAARLREAAQAYIDAGDACRENPTDVTIAFARSAEAALRAALLRPTPSASAQEAPRG